MDTNETIPPLRLMEAVDAIFVALEEMGRSSFTALPSLLMGSAAQPVVFCNFTAHEIREAERFLIRCGLMRIAASNSQAAS